QLPGAEFERRQIGLKFGPWTQQVHRFGVVAELDALPRLAIERLVPGRPTLRPLLRRNRVVPGATGPERIPGRNARVFKKSQDFLTERARHVADDAVEQLR